MKRLLAAALLAATLPAFSQQGGWSDISSSWREIQNPPVTFSIIPAPAGCVATSVPIFLGSPVALGCDSGLTYDAATDTLTVPNIRATIDDFRIGTAGADRVKVNSLGITLADDGQYKFNNQALWGGAADSGLRRVSPGLLGVTSGGSNLGSLQAGNVTATALATPTITSVTRVGTTGSANNVYGVVAYLNDGTSTAISAGASGGATSNAVLDSTNYNVITWPAVANAAYYKLFRYYTESDPFTSGMIYTGTALTFNDTGIVGDGTTAPATNTTGRVLVGDGSPAAPSYSFASDPAAGAFLVGGQLVLNGASGSEVFRGAPGSYTRLGPNVLYLGAATDTPISRGAANTVVIGSSASATPVAQTLVVGESGAGTNIAGANGVISSGVGTGSGAPSQLEFKTPTPGVSGIDKQTMGTKLLLGQYGASVHDNIYPNVSDARKNGNAASGLLWLEVSVSRSVLGSKSKALSADATATDIFTIPLADGAMTAGEIIYRVTASAAGQKQVISGRVRYSAVRDNVTYDCDVSEVGTQTTSVTSGALTGAWTCTAAAGVLTLTANFDSSLDVIPTVYYRIDSTDTLAITPL